MVELIKNFPTGDWPGATASTTRDPNAQQARRRKVSSAADSGLLGRRMPEQGALPARTYPSATTLQPDPPTVIIEELHVASVCDQVERVELCPAPLVLDNQEQD